MELDLQTEAQLFYELLWEFGSASRVIAGYQFRDFVLSHHNAEPLFSVSHHSELSLVGCTCNIWQVDMNRMEILSLTAKAIDSTGSLFNLAGVPR